jgi:hypothetical protein
MPLNLANAPILSSNPSYAAFFSGVSRNSLSVRSSMPCCRNDSLKASIDAS